MPSELPPNTMTRLRRDEEASLGVLIKISTVLNANIGDIMDFVPNADTTSEE